MKRYFIILIIIVLLSFSLVAYSEDLLSFSQDEVIFEEPDDVIYINITNQSSKETILYEVDEFPEFINIDPVEGKIFPLGEERIKVKPKKSMEFKEREGEIVFIYAKKSSPRNLIYKKIKVSIRPLEPTPTPIATPTFTPIPTPTPVPSPTPLPTFTPTPTLTPTPLEIKTPVPIQTPTAVPTPTPAPTFTQTPVPTPEIATPTPEEMATPTPVPTVRPIVKINIKEIGIEGKRPIIYKKDVGFVKLKDEIAIGEKVKFQAIWDKNTLPPFDAFVWETDMGTQIVKVEGEKGEIVTVTRNSKGKGELSCQIIDENGNIIAEGRTVFEVTIGPEVLDETYKLQKEISKKLKSAKIAYKNRSLDTAASLYIEVLSLDPNNKDAKYGLTLVAKARRTQRKAISLYNKASSYLKKGNIKAAYKTIMAIGNYMWAFSKNDPWRAKISGLKKTILSAYRPGIVGGKIKKYIAPGTNLYIYTGTSATLSSFSKKLGLLMHAEKEIPGFDDKYSFYAYQKGIVVKELNTGRWEGIYSTSRTYSLDLAFLKVLSVNKGLLGQMGKGKTPGILLFKGRLKVQIFENGVMVYETKSKTLWYTLF